MIVQDSKTDEPRIGVYVCHCGMNIASAMDIQAVRDFAESLPNVVLARDYKFMCSDPGQELISQDASAHGINRVVVASCSPLLHEATFRKACSAAGINPFNFQMANIREQVSWVTPQEDKATDKARALIAAAVWRVAQQGPLEVRRVKIHPDIMVLGGGIAGIHAALFLADAGRKVHLVEREPSIGGHMSKFDKTFPTLDCAACILTPKMSTVKDHPNIHLMTYSQVQNIEGHVGNFKATVRRKARYVDEEKCTGCGQCTNRCPVQFKPTAGDNGKPKADEVSPEIRAAVDVSLDQHAHERGPLVSVLQDINIEFGYLPPVALKYISEKLQLPLASVYHVATFYTSFSLVPRGKHIIRVCMGTACHVKGAGRVLEMLQSKLGVASGQTTEDMQFTLETVNCLGACALAPAVTVDSDYHGQMSPGKVQKMLDQYASNQEVASC